MDKEGAIKIYRLGDPDLDLKCDLAAEFPIYLYWKQGQTQAFYSTSIQNLLNDARILKPLQISEDGISFLLQCGVVPPPATVFKDIFVIGMGVTATLQTRHDQLALSFKNEFPFRHAKRLAENTMCPDEDLILNMLAQACTERIDASRPSYLFHSAGKDSNMIALALAEAGWQNQVSLLTHQSHGARDESGHSKSIAKKLGFRHITLTQNVDHQKCLTDFHHYFTNVTIPVVDVVTLAYPLYTHQIPDLMCSNVIDGGGNDCYLGSPPTARDMKMYRMSGVTKFFRPALDKLIVSESFFNPLTKTKSEWCGFSGFLHSEAKRLFPLARDTREFFLQLDQRLKSMDDFDFKTEVYSGITIAEMHIRKFRTAADYWSANAILPFANERIADYFAKLPEIYLFSRINLKNKLIFRKILLARLGLDSDALGKLGYHFEYWQVLQNIWSEVRDQILNCQMWQRDFIETILLRLYKIAASGRWSAQKAQNLILRLYLLSAWLNLNRYVR